MSLFTDKLGAWVASPVVERTSLYKKSDVLCFQILYMIFH